MVGISVFVVKKIQRILVLYVRRLYLIVIHAHQEMGESWQNLKRWNFFSSMRAMATPWMKFCVSYSGASCHNLESIPYLCFSHYVTACHLWLLAGFICAVLWVTDSKDLNGAVCQVSTEVREDYFLTVTLLCGHWNSCTLLCLEFNEPGERATTRRRRNETEVKEKEKCGKFSCAVWPKRSSAESVLSEMLLTDLSKSLRIYLSFFLLSGSFLCYHCGKIL